MIQQKDVTVRLDISSMRSYVVNVILYLQDVKIVVGSVRNVITVV